MMQQYGNRNNNPNLAKGRFQYDITTNYANNDKVTIGRITDVRQHCNVQKWKKEPPRLFCSNGKVSLPLIEEPPLILKKLLEENAAEVIPISIILYSR